MTYEFAESFGIPESPIPEVTDDHARAVMAELVEERLEDYIPNKTDAHYERRDHLLGAVQDFLPTEQFSYYHEDSHNEDLVVTAGIVAYELLSRANVEPLPAVESSVYSEMWKELEAGPEEFRAAAKAMQVRHNFRLADATKQIVDYMLDGDTRPDDQGIIENTVATMHEALRRQVVAELKNFSIPDTIPESM